MGAKKPAAKKDQSTRDRTRRQEGSIEARPDETVTPIESRLPIGPDPAAGDEVFGMGKDGQLRRLRQPRIEPGIACADDSGNVSVAFAQPAQDGRFARLATVDIRAHEALRLGYCS